MGILKIGHVALPVFLRLTLSLFIGEAITLHRLIAAPVA